MLIIGKILISIFHYEVYIYNVLQNKNLQVGFKFNTSLNNEIHLFCRVWEYGGYASKGLEQVAKWGSPRALESELKSQSLHIRTIIKARGLWYPNHNGKTFAVFRTDRKNHLVSLV